MNEPLPSEPISVGQLRAFLARMLPVAPRASRGRIRALLDNLQRHSLRRFEEFGALESLQPAEVVSDVTREADAPSRVAESSSPLSTNGNGNSRNLEDLFFRALYAGTTASGKASDPIGEKPQLSAQETAAVLTSRLERESPPQLPPTGLHHFLAARLGLNVQSVRIHVGPAADQFAAKHGADAVTFADRIVFRRRRYEPYTVAGAALLGHEFTHVAAAMRGRSASPAAAAREEQTALANEQRLRVELAAPDGHRASSWPSVPMPAAPAVAAVPAVSTVPTVRAADAERELPPVPTPGSFPFGSAKQFKEEIYRDLLDRIRTDFERGS